MENLIRDGVALAYETRGQGDPPILRSMAGPVTTPTSRPKQNTSAATTK